MRTGILQTLVKYLLNKWRLNLKNVSKITFKMAGPGLLTLGVRFSPWRRKGQPTPLPPPRMQTEWSAWDTGKVSWKGWSGLLLLGWYSLISRNLLTVIFDQNVASLVEAYKSQAYLFRWEQKIWNVRIELRVPFYLRWLK